MEVLDEMTDKNKNHMTSAIAFVEGGVQDACDDACSICLEDFCDSDPSTVTSCKHEFHLQCILEWCQRSSQCPMCLQPISLKNPSSQELFEAVERERNIRNAPVRIPAIFHHPTLGDFELQNLPVGSNDPDLEERIIQHLAAAAAMGRANHLTRRDGYRGRSTGHGRPHFVFLSHPPNAPHPSSVSTSAAHDVGGSEHNNVTIPHPFAHVASDDDDSSHIFFQSGRVPSLASGSRVTSASRNRVVLSSRGSPTSPPVQDGAGPSDFQAFSESLKSKWNAVSLRYKESISKSTRGWRDRLFPRNASMVEEQDSENRRGDNGGVNQVSHLIENLELREDPVAGVTSASSDNSADILTQNSTNHQHTAQNSLVDGNSSATSPVSSISS
ncbi:hypothetical protein MLD38_033138 [Melastoma candidum]|uniref:Uncharacterized protein n=1 Tax=Melastoma candidum TaxID=119954 RepID=A0ACB9M671_9MYRT|nr:hypothetical protein MLD38_033138 [Melastoma candidum]